MVQLDFNLKDYDWFYGFLLCLRFYCDIWIKVFIAIKCCCKPLRGLSFARGKGWVGDLRQINQCICNIHTSPIHTTKRWMCEQYMLWTHVPEIPLFPGLCPCICNIVDVSSHAHNPMSACTLWPYTVVLIVIGWERERERGLFYSLCQWIYRSMTKARNR